MYSMRGRGEDASKLTQSAPEPLGRDQLAMLTSGRGFLLQHVGQHVAIGRFFLGKTWRKKHQKVATATS